MNPEMFDFATLADMIRDDYKIRCPMDVVRTINELGGTVILDNSGATKTFKINIKGKQDWTVTLNSKDENALLYLTKALTHYMLDSKYGKKKLKSKHITKEKDRAAETFSLLLLVPSYDIEDIDKYIQNEDYDALEQHLILYEDYPEDTIPLRLRLYYEFGV